MHPIRSAVSLAAALCSTLAWSQVVIPPGVEPGQIERELQRLRVPEQVPEQNLPATPEQAAPPQSNDMRFVLRQVKVEGATVYSETLLTAPFARYLGQEISVAQVFQIANQLTARYRNDGYILSQVLVPAQSTVDGEVKLLAVEGYVDAVQFRGNIPAGDSLLDAYAARLKATRPLTSRALERCLLLMNDLGMSRARGTLIPSESAQGASHLVVDFARERTRVALATDNRNSRSLGPYRATLDAQATGLLSSWDQLAFKGGSSLDSELNYVGFSYGSSLGASGARWTLGATGVRSHPGVAANLTVTDLKTESISGVLSIDVPIIRSRATNVHLRGSFTSFDGQSEFSLANLSDDRIRAARLGFTVDHADRWRGINILDLEFAHGIDGLGARMEGTADSPLSRANGRADFSKLNLYAARLQSLGGAWSALAAVSAQQAFNPLLASELFAFGGETFGRGYDSAELVGDSGEAVKLELRYAGVLAPFGGTAYSAYGFYDWGRVRRRDAINEVASEHASSAGLGLRFTGHGGHWQGLLEVGVPIDHDIASEGDRDARVFFGLQLNL